MNDDIANPAPLGLMGFGMTTVLLNLHNIGVIDDSGLGMIFSMGIFYGGLAQILAGMWEMKKGNTFGATAFSSFGLFWISFVAMNVFKQIGWFSPSSITLAAYLAMWGLFTLFLTPSTFSKEKSRVLRVTFVSLTILFFWLAIADVYEVALIKTLAGYEGIFCGFSAIYLAFAEVANETFGRDVLPI